MSINKRVENWNIINEEPYGKEFYKGGGGDGIMGFLPYEDGECGAILIKLFRLSSDISIETRSEVLNPIYFELHWLGICKYIYMNMDLNISQNRLRVSWAWAGIHLTGLQVLLQYFPFTIS